MRIRDSVHSDRLPPSYYTATSAYPAAFPRVEGNVKTKVCVIGGGYTGVAATLMLAEAGVDVVLVEQNQIGWGASGRNGGQIIGGFGPDMADYDRYEDVFGKASAETMWHAGNEAVDIVRETVARHAIDCDLTWGYFNAAMKESEMRSLEASKKALEGLGYHYGQRLVGAQGVSSVVGSNRYIGGLINEGWGHCHPLNLVRGQAQAAAKAGARIFEDARVAKLEFKDNKTVVDLGWGKVTAEKVILACNAYLGNLVPKLANRMLPVGSYIIATEPLSPEMQKEILPANHAVCDQRWALDYFRLSADGRLLFGGVATYSGLHPKSVKAKMRPKMLKVFPMLDNVAIDYEWGGYISIGLNRIPQLGRINERTYYAQAFAGHGLAATHVAARMIVEAMGGNDERLRIVEAVKHRPFPGGQVMRKPLLVAGMAFERFKEVLR